MPKPRSLGSYVNVGEEMLSPSKDHPALRVAVLGAGTVGSEVVRLMQEQQHELAQRIGAPLRITGIAVRDLTRERGPHIDRTLLTDDPAHLVRDADIVVELIGGIEPARSLLIEAMKHGASVVTANKALLSQDGGVLHDAAGAAGVDLDYEAAVAAAIPIVRPVRESLAGDRVTRVLGVVNGTTNFMLDAMTRDGASYDEVLRTAQERGYAEADPTADVAGHDAAAKAALLASLAFHTRVALEDVHCEGITAITTADIAAATRMHRMLKLLAIAERVDDAGTEGISVRVYPAMIPAQHPLASVHGAFNAVFVESDAAGELMFYGQGAGGAPTASAVLGDLVTAARHRVQGGRGPRESVYAELPMVPIDRLTSRFHLALTVVDRPGVLAAVAAVLSEHGISISTINQTLIPSGQEPAGEGRALLSISTHEAAEAALAEARMGLQASPAVLSVDSAIRIEGE